MSRDRYFQTCLSHDPEEVSTWVFLYNVKNQNMLQLNINLYNIYKYSHFYMHFYFRKNHGLYVTSKGL